MMVSTTTVNSGSHPVANALHAIGDGVDVVQYARAFAQQLGACFGQLRLSRAAIEEQYVERVLDHADAVGERARHHVAGACRRREAAGANDRVQQRERVRRRDITGG